MKKSYLNKIGKSQTAKMKNKCDKLCTPVIKKLFPLCESCGQPTQVAHHFFEKSRSNRLRYDIKNLIPLCNSCHCKIHNRFGASIVGCLDVSDIIRNKRGENWYNEIRQLSKESVKTDIIFYQKSLEYLESLL